MYGIIASCLVSCATTIVINAVFVRQKRNKPSCTQQDAAPNCSTDDVHKSSSIVAHKGGKSSRPAGVAPHDHTSQQQEDDEFVFTPHKLKPARGSEHSAGPPRFALQSPVNTSKRADPYDPSPRTGYLQWDDYFMALAFLSAQRSKDPNKQVGACIVSQDNIILGIGYNGFPRGCADAQLPWAKKHRGGDQLRTKYPYVVHAEANALLNKNAAVVEGAKVYVTMFPCNECAKLLIQAGITEVVYHEDKAQEQMMPVRSLNMDEDSQQQQQQQHEHACDSSNSGSSKGGSSSSSSRGAGGGAEEACYMASKRLLSLAGVKLRQHQLSHCITLCA